MRHLSPQHEKGIVFFIGCLVIPVLLFIPLLHFGITKYNITGLLNLEGFRIPCHIVSFFLLIWVDCLLSKALKKRIFSEKILIFFNILTLCALLIPYQEEMSFLNTLHITSAYLAFAFFTVLFIYVLRFNQKHLLLFIMTCVLCLFLCLTAGKVTGLSEAIFGSISSILLTLSVI